MFRNFANEHDINLILKIIGKKSRNAIFASFKLVHNRAKGMIDNFLFN
jgi:hypothetical protein